MRNKCGALPIVKNKSGASMMFVLAAMLLLMALGASALAAAASDAGAGIEKRTRNQLMLYADSIDRSIKANLQNSETDKSKSLTETTTLGGQLLRRAYESPSGVTANITPTLDGEALPDALVTVSVNFVPNLFVTDYIGYWEEDDGYWEADEETGEPVFIKTGTIAHPRVPQEVRGGGILLVTTTVEYMDKKVVSVSEYRLTGIYMADNRSDAAPPDFRDMVIHNAGDWGFVSREKADW